MPAIVPVLVTGTFLVLAADQVPKFDTGASCHAAAASMIVNRNEDICKKDESDARTKLEQDWSKFDAADKTHCVSLTRTGGAPSYVEMLTCLEMATAARKLPPADRLSGSNSK